MKPRHEFDQCTSQTPHGFGIIDVTAVEGMM